MEGRAAAHLLGDSRRRARRRGRGGHSQDQRFQSRRQRRFGLFRGQPAARPAGQRGQGVPEAGAEAQEPAPGHGRARAPPDDGRSSRHWTRILSRRPTHVSARATRDRADRRRDRHAASAGAFRDRPPRSARPDRPTRAARVVRRRRELAGPSAIAHDLQDRRRAHAQPRFPVAVQAGADGSRLHHQKARAADDGALATRPVREVLVRTMRLPTSNSMSSRSRSTASASPCTNFPRSRSASAI